MSLAHILSFRMTPECLFCNRKDRYGNPDNFLRDSWFLPHADSFGVHNFFGKTKDGIKRPCLLRQGESAVCAVCTVTRASPPFVT